jgi:hypothetical protein
MNWLVVAVFVLMFAISAAAEHSATVNPYIVTEAEPLETELCEQIDTWNGVKIWAGDCVSPPPQAETTGRGSPSVESGTTTNPTTTQSQPQPAPSGERRGATSIQYASGCRTIIVKKRFHGRTVVKRNHGPRFTISLKRSTQNLQLSTSRWPINPSFRKKQKTYD